MIHLFNSSIGRLRIISYLEGISFLILLFVAVPMKYYGNDPSLVKAMGPVHGALFLWFIFNTLSVGIQQRWKFRNVTWKVLISCIVPLGTFYIDRYILSRAEKEKQQQNRS